MAYLNRADQDWLYKTAAMVSDMETRIENLEQHGRPATACKHIKTRLYTEMDKLMRPLTDDQRAELVRKVNRREVGFYVK